MSIIRIRKNSYGEFEVPAPTTDEIYYTDDKQDAIGTARTIHGCGANDTSIECVIRSGSYNAEG